MSPHELGTLLGSIVIVVSFICGFALVASAARSSQISKDEGTDDE